MKKKAIALASGLCLLNIASAQSSVTLFGIVDLSVRHAKGSNDSMTSVSSGGLASSRMGIRGVEDLGGGLKATFWLENQINADNGTQGGSVFWHRQSTVGLMGNWGEIRLGRELTPTYRTDSAFDPFFDNGVANMSVITKVLAGNTGYRTDNAISYRTPGNLGGWYGHFQFSLAEGNDNNKYGGGQIGYRSGPLRVEGAYSSTRTSTPDNYTHATLGGSYDFSGFRLMGHTSQKKFGTIKYQHYLIAGTVPLAGGTFKLSLAYNQGKGSVDGNDSRLLGVGYVYPLSKRTSLYTAAAWVNNSGSANNAIPTAPAVVPGGKSSGYEFGINHTF